MRRWMLLMLMLALLAVSALAEETDWAQLWLQEQQAALVPGNVEAEITERQYALSLPDGRQALSLCVTAEGDLRFGRYAQLTRTSLLDAETGEELPLDAVFPDPEALQTFLDAYVEENVLEDLNTYLDANDLLPVPLDAVCFDAQGVTFHYPSERFMYFSGHAGAVQLQWYELRELLALEAPEQPFPLYPGCQITECRTAYGSLTDPDLVTEGEIYEFESPVLRGVQAVADETGAVTAVRSARFCLDGVQPGMNRQEAEASLGAPEKEETIGADLAQGMRLRTGVCAQYAWGEYILNLYFDEADQLYMAELRAR